MCHRSRLAGSASSAASSGRGMQGGSQGLGVGGVGNFPSRHFPTFGELGAAAAGRDGDEAGGSEPAPPCRDTGAARAGSGGTVPADASWGGTSPSLHPGAPTASPLAGGPEAQPYPRVASVGRHPPVARRRRPGLRGAGCGRGRCSGGTAGSIQAPRSCRCGRTHSGSSRISLSVLLPICCIISAFNYLPRAVWAAVQRQLLLN